MSLDDIERYLENIFPTRMKVNVNSIRKDLLWRRLVRIKRKWLAGVFR